MNELALFAGAGGGILGGKLLGWRTVCAVERDAYAAQVLAQRQNDGILEAFPIWSDVCSFDGRAWRGIIDVISGGFPCQDISAAGKGAGIEGERSGLWKEFARIIGEVMPAYVYVENSPMLTVRGLGTVLRDLAQMGFDAQWGVLSAADVNAPHLRERIWLLGYPHNNGQAAAEIRESIIKRGNYSQAKQVETCELTRPSKQYEELANAYSKRELQPKGLNKIKRRQISNDGETMANTKHHKNIKRFKSAAQRGWQNKTKQTRLGSSKNFVTNTIGNRLQRKRHNRNAQGQARLCNRERRNEKQAIRFNQNRKWPIEPNVGRVANGVAFRVDRLKAIGNGQVPLCMATAFQILYGRFK